jgi:hypothetical protein
MPDLPLYVRKNLPSVGLIPAPVQILGRKAELNDQVPRQVLWLDFAALLPP